MSNKRGWKQNSKLTHGYWKKKSSPLFHWSLLYFGSGLLPVWLRDIDVLLGSRPLCGSGDAETISRILSTPIWVLIVTLESRLAPDSGFRPPSSDRAAFYLHLRLVVISPFFSFSSHASPQFHETQSHIFYTISEGFGLKKLVPEKYNRKRKGRVSACQFYDPKPHVNHLLTPLCLQDCTWQSAIEINLCGSSGLLPESSSTLGKEAMSILCLYLFSSCLDSHSLSLEKGNGFPWSSL